MTYILYIYCQQTLLTLNHIATAQCRTIIYIILLDNRYIRYRFVHFFTLIDTLILQ